MAIVGNPVDTGLVQSLARPGGNITGSSFFWAEVNAKRLEMLKELMPPLARAGVLVNPNNPAMNSIIRAMTQMAKAIDVSVQSIDVPRIDDLEAAIMNSKSQIGFVVDDGIFVANTKHVAKLALQHSLPSIGFREFCEAGGLAGYGVNFPHIWHGAGAYVDKILKGRKPSDLPVEQADQVRAGHQPEDRQGARP